MTVLHGNVDQVLHFKGSQLEVCGPIFWNGSPPVVPATQLTILSITVIKPGSPPRSAVPASPGNVFTPAANPSEWMYDFDGDWVPGAATVIVSALPAILNRQNRSLPEVWHERVTLETP